MTICLDGTNKSQQQPLLTAWTTGSRRTAAHLYAADTQSAFHQAFGAGLAFNRNFPLSGSIIGRSFMDGGKKINEISLCFWMDINHTSHSLAFLSSVCAGGTVGLGPRSPKQHHPIPDSRQGAWDNDWDDIEIGTPKILKKEKSFVVSCICFLDHHQLMYLLLVGSCHFNNLLFRVGQACPEEMVCGSAKDFPEKRALLFSRQAISRRWCRFKGDKERDTEHRAATWGCATIHSPNGPPLPTPCTPSFS